MKRHIYRPIISAALISLLAAGCSSTAASQQTASPEAASQNNEPAAEVQAAALTPFGIGHLPATGHILFFIGYEEGFFAEEGLDVTLQQFDNNTSELAALESGKIDVAPINASNLVKFIGEGHDLASIGGVMSDGHALVVRPEIVEGVDPADYSLELLRGRKIVLQAGSTYDIEFRMALKEAGLTPGVDVEVVSADSGTSAYNALKSGDVAGAAVYAPFRLKAINEGNVAIKYCDEVDYFDHPICCRSVAIGSKVNSDPDKYIAYTRAMIKASEFLDKDHKGSAADAAKYLDLDTDLLEEETYFHSINNPDPDEAKTVTFYNAMKELGYLDETPDFDITLSVNNEIYEKALDSLIAEDPDNEFYKSLAEYHKNAKV